jgi:hypothetical protein
VSNHVEQFADTLRHAIREEARGLRLHVSDGVLPPQEYALAVGKLQGLKIADDLVGATLTKMRIDDDRDE